MKLVVTLLVRDEEDIVADNINYHLNAGADLLLVTDNGSVDTTRDIVQTFVDEGVARLLVEPAPVHSQWRWVTRMARIAYWDHGADWVINTDADEFWWPESGDLKKALGLIGSEYSALRVPRFDFRPLAGVGGGPRETPYRETSSLRFIGGPLEPKTCHRADPRVIVGQGNHEVSGVSGAELDGTGLLSVFHFPTRSLEQFRRGVANAGAAYRRSTEFVPTTGEVKRALYEALEDGSLDGVFASRELPEPEAEVAIESGEIVADRRLMRALDGSGDRRSGQPTVIVVSLDEGATTPVSAALRDRGYSVSEVGCVESSDSFDGAKVLAFVPPPAEWIDQAIGDGVDVEEAAYEWLGAVAAIGATASSVLWISPSRARGADSADMMASWLDGGAPRDMLDSLPQAEDSALSASSGPALALSRFAYASLLSDPSGFKPLALLIHAATDDPVIASRLGWYLGSPNVGVDVIAALEERLAGAEASYDALRSRKSVKAALSISEVSKLLNRSIRRPQS